MDSVPSLQAMTAVREVISVILQDERGVRVLVVTDTTIDFIGDHGT